MTIPLLAIPRASGNARTHAVAVALALLAGSCANATAKPGQGDEAAAKTQQAAREQASAPKADATRVEVAVLGASDAQLQSVLPGEVEGSRDATLASAQGGPVDRILVEEGDPVKRGQLLALVDTALYEIRKRQAESELARAVREVERAQGLGNALSKAERERRQAQVDILQTNVDFAALQLKRSQIRAPFSGIVSELHTEVGEVVAATAPLMRLVKLDPVHVVLSVPDRDVVALAPGAPVEISVAALPDRIAGEISRISPTGDQDTRAFRVEVEVANGEMRLLPGMIASVSVDRTLTEGAVVIPQDWLVTRRDGVGVFLDTDGVAKYVKVKAGRVVREQVVIDEGLDKGARIVVTGHRQLAEGDKLVVAREGVCCKGGRASF